MEINQAKAEQNPFPKTSKNFAITQVLLRTIAFATTLSATLVMVTNKQSKVLYGFEVSAKYSYSNAFRFLVVADSLACGYSLLSMPFVFLMNSEGSAPISRILFFLLDLMMMILVMSACSAATAISYLARNGNSHTGWMAICDNFGRFCNKAGASLVCSYASFIIFLLLTIISAFKLRLIRVASSSSY